MNKNKAVAYFHPTTVILVDDNKDLIESIGCIIDQGGMSRKEFANPILAYDFLASKHAQYNLAQQCVDQETDPDSDARNVNINITSIKDGVYNPKRFEHITVLVVDHDMPEMSGIDLCRKLKDYPIKKILLTGVATDKQAVDAFNEGLIDGYISKNDDNMEEKLAQAIAELHRKQLEEESAIIVNNLIYPRPGYEKSCLSEEVFINLLDELVQKHNICEYYLSTEYGSYVLFDEQGTPSWLVIKDEAEMQGDHLLAEDDSSTWRPASTEIINALKDRKLVLHTFSKDEGRVEAAEWEAKGFLHPATPLQGSEETYYYAYITNPDAHPIDKDKLLSFEAYKEQLAAQDD